MITNIGKGSIIPFFYLATGPVKWMEILKSTGITFQLSYIILTSKLKHLILLSYITLPLLNPIIRSMFILL